MITSQDGTSTLKVETDWTNSKYDEAVGNSMALNSIFNGVDKNMFRLINKRTKSKEGYDIKIIMSKLQLLTIKFDILRINEDESISDFNMRLCDIVETSFAL